MRSTPSSWHSRTIPRTGSISAPPRKRTLLIQLKENIAAKAYGHRRRPRCQGVKLDLWDVIAMNAWLELDPYYIKWADGNFSAPPANIAAPSSPPGYTADGKPVITHNNWTDYMTGSRWNIMFDIVPERGNRFIMDGMPGLIHSADDFGINRAGLDDHGNYRQPVHGSFDPGGRRRGIVA